MIHISFSDVLFEILSWANSLTAVDILQWVAFLTSGIGSLLVANNTRHSGFGYVAFLISNIFWIAFGVMTKAPGLIATQVWFTGTSLLGLYRQYGFPTRNKI